MTGGFVESFQPNSTHFPTKGRFLLVMSRRERSTASTKYLLHITISSQIMKSVFRRSSASCDLAEVLLALSVVMGIGILNVKCAVRPSSRRTAATADVATAITFFSRMRRMSWMARARTFFFPVPPKAFKNKTSDSGLAVHRGSRSGLSIT